MSHTPGPWEFVDGVVAAPSDHLVADILSDQQTEDGHLIAAAPDLLEALKELLHERTSAARVALSTPAEMLAYRAIAKAEGK